MDLDDRTLEPMQSPISHLSDREERELFDDLNQLDMAEIKAFSKKSTRSPTQMGSVTRVNSALTLCTKKARRARDSPDTLKASFRGGWPEISFPCGY